MRGLETSESELSAIRADHAAAVSMLREEHDGVIVKLGEETKAEVKATAVVLDALKSCNRPTSSRSLGCKTCPSASPDSRGSASLLRRWLHCAVATESEQRDRRHNDRS